MKLRAFVSIDIPEGIKKEIRKIQGKIPEFKGKLTGAPNLHLTLKFLGWISKDKIETIKKELSKIKFKRFETTINSLGIFDNRKSENYTQQLIVWLNLTNCDELQVEVDNALSNLFSKERRFMSHLTIARVKEIESKKMFVDDVKKIRFKDIKFVVDSFRLKQSVLKRTGPVYETLDEYSLD